MDLLDDNRSLIHVGKLLRQPDTGFEWNGWSEFYVLLFDNYCKCHCALRLQHTYSSPFSGHDEAQGQGWRYQVPRQPESTLFNSQVPRFDVKCLIS